MTLRLSLFVTALVLPGIVLAPAALGRAQDRLDHLGAAVAFLEGGSVRLYLVLAGDRLEQMAARSSGSGLRPEIETSSGRNGTSSARSASNAREWASPMKLYPSSATPIGRRSLSARLRPGAGARPCRASPRRAGSSRS